MNNLIVVIGCVLIILVLIGWVLKLKFTLQNRLISAKESEIEFKNYTLQNAQLIDERNQLTEKNSIMNSSLMTLSSELQYLKGSYEKVMHQLDEISLENQRQKAEIQHLNQFQFQTQSLNNQLATINQKFSEALAEIEQLRHENTKINTENRILEHRNLQLASELQTQKEGFEVANLKVQNEIKQLSQQILSENAQKFSLQNQEALDKALLPLREQIHFFNEKLQSQHHEQLRQTNTLNERIKEVIQQTDNVNKVAESLANALKGDTKFQGDWGEMILENILQNAGLEENREYFIQPNFKNEQEDNIRPDIIIQLPGDRKVVIDSKVSLTAYEKFSSAETPEQADQFLEDHLKSIRTHIHLLSQKEYNQIPGSLDFVMLFIPIEPAYVMALKKDQQLWNMAYQKKIILMSSTNLIAAIKLIADLWKREHQHKNALKIAALAEKMHQKLTNFINHFDEIGTQIQKSQTQFLNAQKILLTGKGNLSNQLQQLKNMGIQSKQVIKNTGIWLESDMEEPGEE